jgi:antitoxin VapB
MDDVRTVAGGQQMLQIEGEAARLAQELAELTGQSIAAAVTVALKDYLERERDIRERYRQLQRIAADIRAGMKEPVSSADHNELYGEDGLPA